eukprot:707875-Rhodomonas_salina.1
MEAAKRRLAAHALDAHKQQLAAQVRGEGREGGREREREGEGGRGRGRKGGREGTGKGEREVGSQALGQLGKSEPFCVWS